LKQTFICDTLTVDNGYNWKRNTLEMITSNTWKRLFIMCKEAMNMKKSTASILVFTLTVFLSGTFPSHTAKAALTHTLGNPVITDGVSTWDCVWFGNYYQENSKKKDPIKWRVLSVEGQDAFLMSDQILDHQQYNIKRRIIIYSYSGDAGDDYNKSWADSDIRSWLNKTFINAAFTAGEQKAITTTNVKTSGSPISGVDGGLDTSDKIYLPSFEEVSNAAYGFPVDYTLKSEARKATNTTYTAQELLDHAGSKRELKEFLGYGGWWLRNPARKSHKMYINVNGKDGADGRGQLSRYKEGVRPVLHINLSKADTLTYAGRINSKGEVTEPSLLQTDQSLPSQPVKSENKLKVVQLANVKITSLKNKKTKSVSVKWKKITGAGGYQLQYSTSSKFKKKTTKNTKSVTYLCKKLKKNKKYYFRIRAYRISDKQKIYGCWSKTKKITVKK
jgi:hypothetical protein